MGFEKYFRLKMLISSNRTLRPEVPGDAEVLQQAQVLVGPAEGAELLEKAGPFPNSP